MRSIKKYFPWFAKNPGRVYLNSAATTHKPRLMTRSLLWNFSKFINSDFRAQQELILRYEFLCKRILAKLLKIDLTKADIFFVPGGATACINLVAKALVVDQDRSIILSPADHHANYLPWLQYFKKIEFAEFDPSSFLFKNLARTMQQIRPSLFAVASSSNVLGAIWDKKWLKLKQAIQVAAGVDSLVFLDGSQTVFDTSFSWKFLSPDFFCFSAHKMFGPTNLGVLVVLKKHQKLIHKDICTFLPIRLEIVEFFESLKLIKSKGLIARNSLQRLFFLYLNFLKSVPAVKIISNQDIPSKVITFVVLGFHAHDFADLLAEEKIIVRAGNHCAKPIHDLLEIDNSIRLSLAPSSDKKDFFLFKRKFLKVLNFMTLNFKIS